jgi:hypothetical protein
MVVWFGLGDGLGRDGLVGEKSGLTAAIFLTCGLVKNIGAQFALTAGRAVDPSRHART